MAQFSVPTIGVLALQGNFQQNIGALHRVKQLTPNLPFRILDVRDADTLSQCDGLLIPGGESTAMGVVARDFSLIEPLQAFVRSPKPVFGICAGLILLSDQLTSSSPNHTSAPSQPLIGGLSVTTHRNFFGPQSKSALRTIYLKKAASATLSQTNSVTVTPKLTLSMAHFIRAPAIASINHKNVTELAFIYDDTDSKITVAVENLSLSLLATAFHPEIASNDLFWHQRFVSSVFRSLALPYTPSLASILPPFPSLKSHGALFASESVKWAMPRMLCGGVIMDVVTAEQARIAECAGACAVMALERIPADIKSDGGVARMSDPALIKNILGAVSIPVMAKARIGHFGEAKVIASLKVDCIDESEVLTAADEKYHIAKGQFEIPFVCGAKDLGEALRRIAEGAAMIRLKGNAGTGNVCEAVRHARLVFGAIRKLKGLSEDEICDYAKEIMAPIGLVREVRRLGRLPVTTFAAGGIATPADVLLMMHLGCDGVFVGSGIFKSGNPRKRARAIVHACTYWKDASVVAKVSENLGEAMVGVLRKGEEYAFIHHDSKL